MKEYQVPEPEEFRQWLLDHNLTQAAAARIVGVKHRTVRSWCANKMSATHRNLPYAAWKLLQIEVGET